MVFQGEDLHNPLVLAQGGLQSSQLGADFVLEDFACHHMVAQVKPAETAAVIRGLLG